MLQPGVFHYDQHGNKFKVYSPGVPLSVRAAAGASDVLSAVFNASPDETRRNRPAAQAVASAALTGRAALDAAGRRYAASRPGVSYAEAMHQAGWHEAPPAARTQTEAGEGGPRK